MNMFRSRFCLGVLALAWIPALGCQEREPKTTVVGTSRAIVGTERLPPGRSPVEYVSGVVTLHEGDAITVHVLNYSDAEQPCDIMIYRDSREGPKDAGKTEGYRARPRGVASAQATVKTSGEYWVVIKGDTPLLAPHATIVLNGKAGEATRIDYKPGDFLKIDGTRSPGGFSRGTEREPRGETLRAKPTEPAKDTPRGGRL
jgi:hypothetical protein